MTNTCRSEWVIVPDEVRMVFFYPVVQDGHCHSLQGTMLLFQTIVLCPGGQLSLLIGNYVVISDCSVVSRMVIATPDRNFVFLFQATVFCPGWSLPILIGIWYCYFRLQCCVPNGQCQDQVKCFSPFPIFQNSQ